MQPRGTRGLLAGDAFFGVHKAGKRRKIRGKTRKMANATEPLWISQGFTFLGKCSIIRNKAEKAMQKPVFFACKEKKWLLESLRSGATEENAAGIFRGSAGNRGKTGRGGKNYRKADFLCLQREKMAFGELAERSDRGKIFDFFEVSAGSQDGKARKEFFSCLQEEKYCFLDFGSEATEGSSGKKHRVRKDNFCGCGIKIPCIRRRFLLSATAVFIVKALKNENFFCLQVVGGSSGKKHRVRKGDACGCIRKILRRVAFLAKRRKQRNSRKGNFSAYKKLLFRTSIWRAQRRVGKEAIEKLFLLAVRGKNGFSIACGRRSIFPKPACDKAKAFGITEMDGRFS